MEHRRASHAACGRRAAIGRDRSLSLLVLVFVVAAIQTSCSHRRRRRHCHARRAPTRRQQPPPSLLSRVVAPRPRSSCRLSAASAAVRRQFRVILVVYRATLVQHFIAGRAKEDKSNRDVVFTLLERSSTNDPMSARDRHDATCAVVRHDRDRRPIRATIVVCSRAAMQILSLPSM